MGKKIIASMLAALLIIGAIPIGVSAKWKKVEGQWRYRDGNNYVRGWKNIKGNWYYFWDDYSMLSNGIDSVDGKIYYFDKDGAMRTGWIYVKNSGEQNLGWHYFYSDGSMAADTTIGKYYLNSDGIWDGSTSKITEKQAVEKVKKYLKKTGQHVPKIIEYDHDEGNLLIIHCYDIVTYPGEGSHTATSGWYSVDKTSGKITEMFQ